MPANRLSYLFKRYMDGTSTEREDIELSTYILAPEHAAGLEQLEKEYWEKTNGEVVEEEEAEKILTNILRPPARKATIFSLRRIAVAASILIALATGAYFLFIDKPSKQQELVKTNERANDVEAPKVTKATITLADGRMVAVDSLTSLTQSNVRLIKTADGKIVYNKASEASPEGGGSEMADNTLSNPRGSKVIDMQLADGSHVWLNAGSSVTYPVAFIGNERNVSITGEAYFEVAHHPSMPFTVSKGETRITVLGTHFNVNAYDDETAIKITLLEGSVKVSNKSEEVTIKPGQQVRVTTNQQLQTINSVDLTEVMAWKNGLFRFDRADIGTVMRQISRWYDVEVEYRGEVTQHFGGTVSKLSNVSKVFEMLEMTGGVKFRVEGNKVIVMP